MPKTDFNQEFPTRASLRRAREEQQEVQRQAGASTKKAVDVSADTDVFDAVPEAGGAVAGKPVTTPAAKPAAPAAAQGKKKTPSATSAAPVSAPGKKSAPSAKSAPKPAAASVPKPADKVATPAVGAKVEAKAAAKTAEVVAKPVQSTPAAKQAQVKNSTVPAKPAETKAADTKRAAPAAAQHPAPKLADTKSAAPAAAQKPAPKAAPAKDVAAPVVKNAAAKVAPAKTDPAKSTQTATPAKVVPAKEAPAVAATSKPTAAAKSDDLLTAEGRRQAFRDMNPSPGERDTFLRPEDETTFRAERGFRGFLSRMGFNMEPSAQEVEERNWRRTVGTRLNESKTISVVNGKGGANKTPTAVLLSAVFGRNSGDPVLVWDNNGTRGTLGWRTLKSKHNSHSMDLLAAVDKFKDTKVGDPILNDYVHYQPEDCYSVLRTDPTLLASEQYVNAADLDAMHEIVSRFFALTIMDSGNDESAERWMRMIDHTDQLVIASTTVEEHAEAGALLLEALAKRGGHYADLAKNAVVIVSQHQPQGNDEQLNRIAHGFRRLARSVVTVPYDAALVKGQIRFDDLRPGTRRAWLHATAAVAGALHS